MKICVLLADAAARHLLRPADGAGQRLYHVAGITLCL
jgi:hypothetical protein